MMKLVKIELKTMQKQSKSHTYLEPIALSSEFPVSRPVSHVFDDYTDDHPHIHDCFEIGYCHSGSGVFIVGGEVYSFQAGDGAVVNAHDIHLIRCNSGEQSRWSFLHLDLSGLLSECPIGYSDALRMEHVAGKGFRNVLCHKRFGLIVPIILQLLKESDERQRNYRSLIRSLVWQLLIQLDRYFPNDSTTAARRGNAQDIMRIFPAINHIGTHFFESMDVPSLASSCFMSEANFRKVFHKALGISPQLYIRNVRLNAAVAMLRHSDKPISSIALACGFQQLSGFNRHFQERYGMSPRDMRNQSLTYGRS